MHRFSSAASLVHRGRVELEGLLQDVTFHLVFTLVYDVRLGFGGRSDTAAKRVPLLYAVKILQPIWTVLDTVYITSRNLFLVSDTSRLRKNAHCLFK